jgi:hypothetical protein
MPVFAMANFTPEDSSQMSTPDLMGPQERQSRQRLRQPHQKMPVSKTVVPIFNEMFQSLPRQWRIDVNASFEGCSQRSCRTGFDGIKTESLYRLKDSRDIIRRLIH